MNWILALGEWFRTFLGSQLGETASIGTDLSLLGITLHKLITGRFSLTKLNGVSGALAQGRERRQRKRLRRLSFFQFFFVIIAVIAACYVYLIAPVGEQVLPDFAQSIAFCALALSSAVIILAWFLMFLLKPDE